MVLGRLSLLGHLFSGFDVTFVKPSCCDFASPNLHTEHQPAAVVRCSPVLRSLWLPAGAAAGSRVQKQDLSQTPVTLWELLKRSCLQTLSGTTLHRLQNQTRKNKSTVIISFNLPQTGFHLQYPICRDAAFSKKAQVTLPLGWSWRWNWGLRRSCHGWPARCNSLGRLSIRPYAHQDC